PHALPIWPRRSITHARVLVVPWSTPRTRSLTRPSSSRPDGKLAPGLRRRVHLRGVLPCPPVLRVRRVPGRGGVEQPPVDLSGRVRLRVGRRRKEVLQVIRDRVEQV